MVAEAVDSPSDPASSFCLDPDRVVVAVFMAAGSKSPLACDELAALPFAESFWLSAAGYFSPRACGEPLALFIAEPKHL